MMKSAYAKRKKKRKFKSFQEIDFSKIEDTKESVEKALEIGNGSLAK